MAIQKVPVFDTSTGQFRNATSSDTFNLPTAATNVWQMVNDNAAAITVGKPVYVKSNGNVDLARANAASTTDILGLVYDASIAAAGTGAIATDGPVTATTAQWDAITGDTGGLVPGSTYFLSAATAGAITKTCPSTAGQFAVRLGKALSATVLDVTVEPPYAL